LVNRAPAPRPPHGRRRGGRARRCRWRARRCRSRVQVVLHHIGRRNHEITKSQKSQNHKSQKHKNSVFIGNQMQQTLSSDHETTQRTLSLSAKTCFLFFSESRESSIRRENSNVEQTVKRLLLSMPPLFSEKQESHRSQLHNSSTILQLSCRRITRCCLLKAMMTVMFGRGGRGGRAAAAAASKKKEGGKKKTTTCSGKHLYH
jgi:hypothetical protein